MPRWTLDGSTENLLGQCDAFVHAMLGTPIRPDYRQKLLRVSLARDLAQLVELQLAIKDDSGYRTNIGILRALAPASTGRIG